MDSKNHTYAVRDLTFSYGKQQVLQGLSMDLAVGKITTLIGANGCGKSTLFHLLTKNLKPESGSIFLQGKDLQEIRLKDLAKQVAIVHQYNTAPVDLTVERLVAYGRTPHRTMGIAQDPAKDEAKVRWAMEITDILGQKDKPVAELSGGQRQRVWIAMALAQDTKMLFLDEPTTYLDIRYQIEILELVQKLNRELSMTILMVLHDINQAIQYSHEIIGMKDGKIAVWGKPEEVINSEVLQEIYGIRLDVAHMKDQTWVMTAGRSAAETEAREKSKSEERIVKEEPEVMEPEERIVKEEPEVMEPEEHIVKGETAVNERIMKETAVKEPEETSCEVQASERKRQPLRVLWLSLGCLCLVLGTIGIVLPFLPTVPFYLATLFCFAKSSKKLYNWFTSTGLYKKHLDSFVKKRSMTVKSKLTIMGTVTAVMAVGFIMMHNVPAGRICMSAVWVMHVIIFVFFIKTEPASEQQEQDTNEEFNVREQDAAADSREQGSDVI